VPGHLAPSSSSAPGGAVDGEQGRGGFRCIRMVNNICLNFDAFHGGVRDGTNTVLWKWCEGDNQRWKIVPWCKPLATHMTLAFQYTSLALLDGVSFYY
jgi:hypothetical protein